MNRTLKTSIEKNHPGVTIVVASKYLTTPTDFRPFLDANHRVFGENRVETLLEKRAWFQDEAIEWHYIGTLQTKKVKKVVDAIDVLHSLDRIKLAEEIDKRRQGKPLPCFVQVNISGEAQKHGIEPDAVPAFLEAVQSFEKLTVIGLMGMAEETDDDARIRHQFETLVQLRDAVSTTYPTVKRLSMGMTQDYRIALELGADTLRLGRVMLREDTHGT